MYGGRAVTVERLTDEDARILARERGSVRGHIAKVLIVDGVLDVDELRGYVEPRIASIPRLRDRLAVAPLGLAPPAWVPDGSFSLDRHVRDGGRAADHAAVERAVAALMEAPLDRDVPLWSIDVIALGEARTALVLRLHHCMADGMTSMRIVRDLLLDGDTEAPPPAPPPAAPPTARALASDAARWRAGWAMRGVAGAARDLTGRAPASADAAERRARRAAIMRQLTPEGRPSALARRAGPRRTVAFSSFPLEDLKAVGHSAPERATVAGGLRRWFAHLGAEPHELRVKVPVSLHQPG